MADIERSVVNHYNLTTPYPNEWPKELDESDDEELSSQAGVRRSRSRYSALERSASDLKRLLPGSQKTRDGHANLAQKDEPDPMGGTGSVVQALRQKGLPVEQDQRLRDRFMLSSTTFSPSLFLSNVHSDDRTEDLIHGMQYLSQSIDQKSASLKTLVEANFERFVRAKATIDNVYTEMRNQGMEAEEARPLSPRPHSRQVSRQSGIHYRNFSNASASALASAKPTFNKNALRKETEYGVQGLRAPLLEASQKAEDVWGPALGGKEREATLKAIAEAIEHDRELYELGGRLRSAIKQSDLTRAVELSIAARDYVNQARIIAEQVMQGGQALSDDRTQRIIATGRMWLDVEKQIELLKQDIWRRLSNSHSALPLPGASLAEEHMELIGVLLELGVDDNPIWIWLLSRYDHLKTKISAVVDRSKVEIEILRRRLALKSGPSSQTVARYLRQATTEHPEFYDTNSVVEFWTTINTYMTKLLSISSGLLGEIVDFWDSAKSFIDGHKQKDLPTGYEGQSRHHHRLSDAGVRQLQRGTVELANMIKDAVSSIFCGPPTEDISSLFSPNMSAGTPTMNAFSPTEGRIGNIDVESMPAPSARSGQIWDDFAFWPPHSNSLSAIHHLSTILVLVATAASEMAALGPLKGDVTGHESIQTLIASCRERSLRAIGDAWANDAESCKDLEDWTRLPDKHDRNKLPQYFAGFEKSVLNGMQRILWLSEVKVRASSRDIIPVPSSTLLQNIRTQFVSSIQKAVSGISDNATTDGNVDEDDWISGSKPTFADSEAGDATAETLDPSDQKVRTLLTLSNLNVLRNEHLPQLIAIFESSFSVKLTEETRLIRDAIGRQEAMIFKSYTRPIATELAKTISNGINSPDWAPGSNRPDQVRPYVYATLFTLVAVHREISTTVSPPTSSSPPAYLLQEILASLLEIVSQSLLDSFKDRKPSTYNLPSLMQATLDTEFIAQTMSQYATDKAGAVQGQIYMELDKRTTNDARAKLQQEFGDMRVVLKRLRESSRNSFACFKKARTDRGRGERAPMEKS